MKRAFALIALLLGCAKHSAAALGAAVPPSDPQALAAAEALTDDKMLAFVAYLKALETTITAAQPEGLNALALGRAGISADDATRMAHLLAAYNRAQGLGIEELNADLVEVKRRVSGAQAHDKTPAATDVAMAKDIMTNLDALESRRAERMKIFVATYGQPVADLLAKHHDDYQAAAGEISRKKIVARAASH